MEDGTCYERRGNMNYVAPCKQKKSPKTSDETSQNSLSSVEQDKKCFFKIGEYKVQYLKPQSENDDVISCSDSRQYIDTMSLGYDKSLKTNKTKIGDVVVRKGLSKCTVELYHGDFMTIGLMSGNRLMSDNFMVYHSTTGAARGGGQ